MQEKFKKWICHLFHIKHKQFILITHATSLYTLIVPGAGITNVTSFMRAFEDNRDSQLEAEGLKVWFDLRCRNEAQTVSLSNTVDRRLTGSMNDMVRMLSFGEGDSISIIEMANSINETPFSQIDMDGPRMCLKKMIEFGLRLL